LDALLADPKLIMSATEESRRYICPLTHIVDLDHLVPDMAKFVEFLAPTQVFSGKTDPFSNIQNGTLAQIAESVRECRKQATGRVIVSAGCEVPPDTSLENMWTFRAAS